MNRPLTVEGRQVWQLVTKLGGQIRIVTSAFGSVRFVGWEMGAAIALGDALGVPRLAVAELLPEIEAVAMAKMNEQAEASDNAS